jgi:hypothetical protein
MNDCATKMNAEHARLVPQIFIGVRKTGVDYRRIFFSYFLFKEIVMTSLRMNASRTAIASIVAMSYAATAFASQGPGGGTGTASHLTQMAMAALVYGISAVVVGAGLIGAVRGR